MENKHTSHKHISRRQRLFTLLRENGIEISAVLLGLAGLYLYFFQRQGIQSLVSNTSGGIRLASQWIIEQLLRFTIFELAGILFGLAAVGLIYWRARVRIQRLSIWNESVCPRCSSDLKRVHRRWYDRLFGRFFISGLRRYRCSKADCRWSGLRNRSEEQSRSRRRRENPITEPRRSM